MDKDKDEIKVYGPSFKALRNMLIFGTAVSIPSFIYALRSDEPISQNFISYIMIFMIGALCLNIWSFYKKLPQITLTSVGIELNHLFGKKFYSWADAGPFRSHTLDSKHMHVGYLCAHSKETEEILRGGNSYVPADNENASIIIILQGLTAGLSDEGAEKLAEEVNIWRKRYSPQESSLRDASQDTFSQVKADLKRKKIKSKLLTYSIVAVVMAIIFYNVIWVKDHSELNNTISRIQELGKE